MMQNLNRILRQFLHGLFGFLRGVGWLASHPGIFALLMIPWLIGIGVFIGLLYWSLQLGMAFFMSWLPVWIANPAEGLFWANVLSGLAQVSVVFAVGLASTLVAVAFIGLLSSPIYEVISIEIEKDMFGATDQPTPWSRLPQLMLSEMGKSVVIISIPILMILIPGVNLAAGIVAAFLLGWDYYDYPLARRAWTLRDRWNFVKSEGWTVLGFGVWLTIPVLQILFVPMAIAGGTILNLEALERRGHIKGRPGKTLGSDSVPQL